MPIGRGDRLEYALARLRLDERDELVDQHAHAASAVTIAPIATAPVGAPPPSVPEQPTPRRRITRRSVAILVAALVLFGGNAIAYRNLVATQSTSAQLRRERTDADAQIASSRAELQTL